MTIPIKPEFDMPGELFGLMWEDGRFDSLVGPTDEELLEIERKRDTEQDR